MQHIDRPAHVETLAEPRGARRARVETQPFGLMLGLEPVDGVIRHRDGDWYVGEYAAVRAPEQEAAIGHSCDLVPVLVDRAMVAPTEQDQIRQHGRAAVRPVLHVVPLADPPSTAREATTLVSMVERAPQRGRNGPGAGAHLDPLPV